MTFPICPDCGEIMEVCMVLQEGLEHHFYMCPKCKRTEIVEEK
jgi:predicted RNA-binding Zn-ribbon protein involved in translation (DUF1610 family)